MLKAKTKIINLKLSTRTLHLLLGKDIDTVGKLVAFSERRLLSQINGFGQACLNEVKRELALHGLTLRDEVDLQVTDALYPVKKQLHEITGAIGELIEGLREVNHSLDAIDSELYILLKTQELRRQNDNPLPTNK